MIFPPKGNFVQLSILKNSGPPIKIKGPMHFSDFEPNLAEKDVPDYKVVPKIFQMLLGGSGLKI